MFGIRHFISVIFSTILITGCGTSAVIKDVKDKKMSALEMNAAFESKPIQLAKVVVKLKRGQHIGAVEAGLACLAHGDLNWKGGRVNVDSDELTEVFKEELEKYNFKAVGDTNALFEDPATWKSEILVAGLIKDLKANICFPWAGFYNYSSAKGEAYVKVDWQIYSKLDRAVVHSVTTEGAYKETTSKAGGGEEVIMNAFAQAARNLLADEKFREIVLKGGKAVRQTVFKSADNLVLTPGKAKPIGENPDEWKDGMVTVYAGRGHGSGFAISENVIITNHHVVNEAKNLVVKFGSGFEVPGEVVAYNSAHDVAAIQLKAVLPRYFKIDRKKPETGSEVYAAGSPLSDEFDSTISKGIVSGFRKDGERAYIQSDVNVRPGSSGGPLLLKNGQVVGITVAGVQIDGVGQGINFFIPIADAMDAMKITQ